jgi:hypothetical protein
MRYKAARKPEKTRILNEFCQATGYNRKYALGVLCSLARERTLHIPSSVGKPIKRPRASKYTSEVKKALLVVWKASNFVCGKRLAPFLPDMVSALERASELNLSAAPSVRARLLGISAATIDRLLSKEKRPPLRGRSTTKPGTLLRNQIPIRTFSDWKESEQKPGFCEVDLVAHCGESASGEFLYSLVLTDLYLGWTIPLALRNKSEAAVSEAIRRARVLLPFPLLGLDSDNGSEFINHNLVGYCEREGITFTRCRPYHKNDQCHVEQKNWTIVRQVVGYSRFEGVQDYNRLTELYDSLRLHVNFFQPSRKLTGKQRIGSKMRKTYDKAQTPYQRLMASGHRPKRHLNEMYESLNPLELLRKVYDLQEKLEEKAKVRFTPEASKAA